MFDLSAAPLAEPERVRIFLSEAAACAFPKLIAPQPPLPTIHALDIAPGVAFSWDGQIWTILNQGAQEITLRPAEGDLICLPNADFAALFQQGKITGLSTSGISAGGMTPEGRERYAKAHTAHHQVAIYRAEKIAPYLAGCPPEQETPPGEPFALGSRYIGKGSNSMGTAMSDCFLRFAMAIVSYG